MLMSFDNTMLRQTVVLFAGFCIVSAAVGRAALAEKPEEFKDVEGCYIEEVHNVIPFGEAVPSPSGCFEYRCGTEEVLYISCGAVGLQPPYEVVVDKTQPYPGCCPQIRLAIENNTIT